MLFRLNMSCSTVQSFNLPGEICRKFAVDWSQDNKISICTSKGIYILSSFCSPVETEFPTPLHKQVILAPEQTMQLQPIYIPGNPYSQHFRSLFSDESNMPQILMDHTLNPLPPERAEAFRSYRCAKWSPKGAGKGGRCILATLTMDHRLALYEEVKQEWVCICDLTEVLKTESEEIKEATKLNDRIENHKELFSRTGRLKKAKKRRKSRVTRSQQGKTAQSADEEEPDIYAADIYSFEKMMTRTYKIAPVEITWTSMLDSPECGEYCFLIVAMKSGHIQFWKIASNETRIISLAHEWDTGLGTLTAMCWQQTSTAAGFLMCGTLKGIFAFIPVSMRANDADQRPMVVVKDMYKVWDEEDHITVDHIAVLKIALKKYVIIAAKQHALVGCEIFLTDASIIIRNVGHSFGLHKTPVTGMSVLDSAMPQFRLLIATMEGLLVEIKISVKDDEIKFQHEKLSVDLDLTHLMIQGLAVSTNGILCSVVLHPATYFDHLEKKEPLKFAMFTLRTFDEIYARLKNVLKPTFSFLPSSSSNIGRHTDFLECIRINLACGTPLPDWLNALIDCNPSDLEHTSALELHTVRFLLHSCVSGLAVAITKDKDELESKLYAVEAIIMKKYISKVFGRCQDKIDLLTPAQGQSLLLMADWLLIEFQMPVENLYSALGCDMPADSDSVPSRETCRICKGEVKLDAMKKGKCAKGHTFARCCQSLLLCDLPTYHQCVSCKSLAFEDVWNYDSNCTFCGMLLV